MYVNAYMEGRGSEIDREVVTNVRVANSGGGLTIKRHALIAAIEDTTGDLLIQVTPDPKIEPLNLRRRDSAAVYLAAEDVADNFGNHSIHLRTPPGVVALHAEGAEELVEWVQRWRKTHDQ